MDQPQPDSCNPWTNPSKNAAARVKEPLPKPTICPCCMGTVIDLINNQEVYGRPYGDWPYLFLCRNCGAYVGLHPYTDIPLGTLANEHTRKARMAAKEIFNRIWQGKGKPDRSVAYAWLAERMRIPVSQCHFGWFDAETCRRAAAICQQHPIFQPRKGRK